MREVCECLVSKYSKLILIQKLGYIIPLFVVELIITIKDTSPRIYL